MMHQQRQRIKNYIPGFLSLMLLLPLLLYQLSRYGVFEQQYCLEVTWVDARQLNTLHQYFPPSKDHVKILLTGNSSDAAKVDYAKIVIDEIIAQEDTTRVVQISFVDTAKYEWFVRLLDFCDQRTDLRYGPFENKMLIRYRWQNKEQKNYFSFGQCIVYIDNKVPTDKASLDWIVTYEWNKSFWPIALIFVVLVVVNLKRLRALRLGHNEIR